REPLLGVRGTRLVPPSRSAGERFAMPACSCAWLHPIGDRDGKSILTGRIPVALCSYAAPLPCHVAGHVAVACQPAKHFVNDCLSTPWGDGYQVFPRLCGK